jgi:mitochondrial fusion and transport protein UGO1
MTHSTSLLLRSRLNIDPVLTPVSFSVANFVSSTVELFLKLPLETVLRRGQVSVLSSPTYVGEGNELATIVNIGSYRGPIRTMWMIVHEEGVSSGQDNNTRASGSQTARNTRKKRERKGQGIEGLWRGWRVGFWGLVGVWGAATIGGVANSRGEF